MIALLLLLKGAMCMVTPLSEIIMVLLARGGFLKTHQALFY